MSTRIVLATTFVRPFPLATINRPTRATMVTALPCERYECRASPLEAKALSSSGSRS